MKKQIDFAKETATNSMEQVTYRPQMPCVTPMRVFPGTLLRICGRSKFGPRRFGINLQLGPGRNPRDDIALHLSAVFEPQPKIVRNSLLNNTWSREESYGHFPLVPGQEFEVMILVNEDQFMIAFNGAHYCEFKHRTDYRQISYLTIDGDVDIEKISISESFRSWQGTSRYDQVQMPRYDLPYDSRPPPQSQVFQPLHPSFPPTPSAPHYGNSGSLYPHPTPSGPQPSAPFYGNNRPPQPHQAPPGGF